MNSNQPSPMNMHTHWIRQLLVRDLDGLVSELHLYPDDALVWATAPGITNAAGTITLHLCGNLQHFVGAVLGATGYARNRELEFSQRGLPRSALLAEIATTRAVVIAVLEHRADDDLLPDYPDVLGGLRLPCGLFLQHLSTHLAHHLGQVGYLRRMLTGDARSAGAIAMHALSSVVSPAPR